MAANPIRLRRLMNGNGSILMVPLDHGISMGPLAGLELPDRALAAVASHATCTTVHKGLVPHAAAQSHQMGVLMHLSASTESNPDPNDKRLVGTVQEAVRLGCDGVSIHINLGATTESRMVEDAGKVSAACADWGMPLLAMVYPRGPAVDNPFDPGRIAHAARLGAELGADIVKVPYTGSPDTFRPVVDGCPVPVVVSGGPRQADFAGFAEQIRGAAAAGARGVSIGRNVFQHPKPDEAMAAIAGLFP